MPIVSIYLPTKNRLELLKRAIASVLAQTETNWELIVVDDGSTDATPAYLQELAQADKRVRYIRHEYSVGAPASRNEAISAAHAELVTGLDDDDEFVQQRLGLLLENYDPNYAFICAASFWISDSGEKVLWDAEKELTLSDMMRENQASNQVLVSKEKLLTIGGFDTDFQALQDYDCWVRLIEAFGPAKRIATPLMKVNVGHGLTRITDDQKAVEGYQCFYQRHKNKMSARQRLRFQLRIKEKKSLSQASKLLFRGLTRLI
ncbi:glycosyltransferase [Pseudidiomarina insulisalsae]|uniref:glycosyltransferase n=1 Tax=Pseudidiomarina insulisalsae TaxID=575789 RepID=UPI0013002B1B|nr:glycosyltransferase [Pseudidiomarina insulisalsae]